MHARCEDVVGRLATLLGLTPLPEFRRHDTVRLTYAEESPASEASTGFVIRLSSLHSDRHITPLVQSADVSFPVSCCLLCGLCESIAAVPEITVTGCTARPLSPRKCTNAGG